MDIAKVKFLSEKVETLRYMFKRKSGKKTAWYRSVVKDITIIKRGKGKYSIAEIGGIYIKYIYCIQIDNILTFVGFNEAVMAVLNNKMQVDKVISLNAERLNNSFYMGTITHIMKNYILNKDSGDILIPNFYRSMIKDCTNIKSNIHVQLGEVLELGTYNNSTVYGVSMETLSVLVPTYDTAIDLFGNGENHLDNNILLSISPLVRQLSIYDQHTCINRNFVMLYFVRGDEVVDIGCSVNIMMQANKAWRDVTPEWALTMDNRRFAFQVYYSLNDKKWKLIGEPDIIHRQPDTSEKYQYRLIHSESIEYANKVKAGYLASLSIADMEVHNWMTDIPSMMWRMVRSFDGADSTEYGIRYATVPVLDDNRVIPL